jgi:DNA processing protein
MIVCLSFSKLLNYQLAIIIYHLLTTELLYQLALTEVPNIGCVHAKILTQEFGSAEKIFKSKQQLLEKIEGIGEVRAKAIKAFNNFSKAGRRK